MRLNLNLLIVTMILLPMIGVAQFNPNWTQDRLKSHYWDLNGNKIECELKMRNTTSMGEGTTFKVYVNGKKKDKLYPSEVQSVVYGRDSFVVIKRFNIGAFAAYEEDFAKVKEVGPINLFIHYSKVRQSTGAYAPGMIGGTAAYITHAYVVNINGTDEYRGIYNKKQFELWFIPMISDDKELLSKVYEMKKRNWISSLPALIKDYNRGKEE